MTDRMLDEQLDREISSFLALRADEIANAPTAAEMAARISSRVGTRTAGLRMTPQLVWVVLAGLLTAALIGAVLVGATLLRNDLPPSRAGNGWIAVSANPSSSDLGAGENGDIYLVAEGSGARRIIGSDGDGVAQACPRFSPDGRRLAYGEARASGLVTTFRGVWPVPDRAVVVVGLNDRGDASPPIVRLTLPPDPGQITCPEWSPSGRQVAFRVGPELWVADAASGETTVFPVTEAPWGQQGFEWSRDGFLIAVAEPGHIRLVRMDGRLSKLIPVKGATPGSLGWTVGDLTIVYTSTDAPGDGLAVNIVNVDGTNDMQLTADAVGSLQVTARDALLSPDGTRLAYVQTTFSCVNDGCTPGSSRVLTMDTDGSNVTLVPIPQDTGRLVQWSPDGERLLFGSIAGVVSVAVTPGSPAIVHSSSELNLEWSGSQLTWQPVVP